jgi:anti-sigma factor RsiW
MQCAESLRAQAYFDRELESLGAVEIERHAQHCRRCYLLLQGLKQLRTALQRELSYVRVSPALQARLARALNRESTCGLAPLNRQRVWPLLAFWRGAFAGIGGTAIAAGLAFFALAKPVNSPLSADLLAAHVRSLMPEHLIDVVSSDQHTVKPWFAGHADVSPAVGDFESQGYKLVGGRADYFDHQRAAAVVYRRGAHVINVFSWGSNRRALPKNTTRDGYHLAFWESGDLAYCAVSDAGWDELRGLVKLIQDLTPRDSWQTME